MGTKEICPCRKMLYIDYGRLRVPRRKTAGSRNHRDIIYMPETPGFYKARIFLYDFMLLQRSLIAS